jgi:hypothetical protein
MKFLNASSSISHKEFFTNHVESILFCFIFIEKVIFQRLYFRPILVDQSLLNFKMWRVLEILFQFPFKSIRFLGTATKNTVYMMFVVLIMGNSILI